MGGINGGIPSLYNHFQILAEYILNLEKGTDEPIYKAGIEMQMKRRDTWIQWGRGGKDGEGGMNGERSTDIYTQPCVNAQIVGSC